MGCDRLKRGQTWSEAVHWVWRVWAQDDSYACLLLGESHLIAQDGWTPLIESACKGHLECAQLLLDRSANIDAASKVRMMRGEGRGRMMGGWRG